jgi:hypothetical protein
LLVSFLCVLSLRFCSPHPSLFASLLQSEYHRDLRTCPSRIYYNLLRPELVRANPKPLSSDALMGNWTKDDPEHDKRLKEVEEASVTLHVRAQSRD